MTNNSPILLFPVVLALAGCASTTAIPSGPPSAISDPVATARSIATQPVFALDLSSPEQTPVSRSPMNSVINPGCPLDFYTLHTQASDAGSRQWHGRQIGFADQYGSSVGAGYLGSYRRFVTSHNFDQGQSVLTAQTRAELAWFAKELLSSPYDIYVTVIGRTNSDGPAEYNQRLSERRAHQAAQYLIGLGLPASNVHEIGVGESVPVVGVRPEQRQIVNRGLELATYIAQRSPESGRHSACDLEPKSRFFSALDGQGVKS